MLKLFTKLLMLVLVLALAGPFILKGPDGQPLLDWRDWIPAVPKVSELLPGPAAPDPTQQAAEQADDQRASIQWSAGSERQKPFMPEAGVVYPKEDGVFYRYQNSNGVWQFADTPKPGVPNYKSQVDPDANLMQSLSKERIDDALGRTPPPAAPTANSSATSLPTIPLPTTVPVQEIPNLIQQAKDVQNLVNERTRQLEQQGR